VWSWVVMLTCLAVILVSSTVLLFLSDLAWWKPTENTESNTDHKNLNVSYSLYGATSDSLKGSISQEMLTCLAVILVSSTVLLFLSDLAWWKPTELTPLSQICQLYRGGHFYSWMKPDLSQVTEQGKVGNNPLILNSEFLILNIEFLILSY
jgi:hypothetical protein